MKVYEVIFDDENENIFAMSFVNNPANETQWITMSEQIELSLNEEKQLVSGVVLIPNQLIPRKPAGNITEPFAIVFSEETIQKLAYDFIEKEKANNLTTEHNMQFEGAKVVESYISKNENELGLGAPKGSWIITYHITDESVWNDVKNGKFNGFSIEGNLALAEIKMSDEKDIEIDDEIVEEIIKEIKKLTEQNED